MNLLNLSVIRIFLILTLFTTRNLAQQANELPRHMTPEEALNMQDYLADLSKNRSVPVPPPAPVRTMAEWEELQALIITWAGQQTILREIVRNAVKECKVLIVTDNPTNVTNQLTNANIPLDSVRFVEAPFNTIWVRDYGPWTVYKNDVDSLWIVDWIYNRPRPEDDHVPAAIADYLGLPIFEATSDPDDWVHTGGNHLPDGMGTVFSSNLVLDENPDKTEAEIDSIARKYLGVKQYIKFPTLPYDGIHHLDMHMRVIDEETILIGEYPSGIADGPQIEANIQYLQDSFKTSFGHPYKIVRLPMPPDQNGRYPNSGGSYRTYTNSIFVNKTILVPTYQEKYDTTALRIYRENLPGYNVVGINCNSIIGSLGALHCITKTVGDDDPLLIAHARLRDVPDSIVHYPVEAYIRHRDGIASATLHYRTSRDSLYTSLPMFLADTANNIWQAVMTGYPAGTEVQYYIEALANNGKQQVRPLVAPEGYFRFNVTGEIANQPPSVRIIDPVNDTIFPLTLGHYPITFEATDPDGEIMETRLIINFEEIARLDTLPYVVDWTFPDAGTYFAHVSAMDDDSLIVYSEMVTIVIEASTATPGMDRQGSLRLYPNPVADILYIDLQKSSNRNPVVEVINLLGQKVATLQTRDGDCIGLDFSVLSTGMYMVRIGEEVRIVYRR